MPGRPGDRFEATYLIETPFDLADVAEVMAGEQSCGTFARVAGETDALRERARAIVTGVEELPSAASPSLPSPWLARKGMTGPYRRAQPFGAPLRVASVMSRPSSCACRA